MRFIPKVSDRVKQVVKFEIKLLVGVAVGSLLLFWMLNTLIYTAADYVENAYTGGFAQSSLK